jgi:hypothetical protein
MLIVLVRRAAASGWSIAEVVTLAYLTKTLEVCKPSSEPDSCWLFDFSIHWYHGTLLRHNSASLLVPSFLSSFLGAIIRRYFVPGGMTVNNSDVAVSPSAWKSGGKGATVHAFRRAHWASWMFDVDEVRKDAAGRDDDASTIVFGKGGYQGCRGGNGSDWFVENVLELLDSPLEHYIDAQAAPPVLYFQPNSTSSQPEADLVFEVPILQTLVR